jgi:hypothetical protein
MFLTVTCNKCIFILSIIRCLECFQNDVSETGSRFVIRCYYMLKPVSKSESYPWTSTEESYLQVVIIGVNRILSGVNSAWDNLQLFLTDAVEYARRRK